MGGKGEGKCAAITAIDLRIMIAVGICALSATAFAAFGWKMPVGEARLEILQKMTACIACLLCCQENAAVSRKAGWNRLIITAVGGLAGILVICIEQVMANAWLMAVMVAAGVLLTLWLCKLTGVPYINARIGGVTFVLVVCTLNGSARLWYAFFRLLSTMYGVAVVLLVTWGWEKIAAVRKRRE